MGILLENEQKQLLEKFVEAHRTVPQGMRGAFFVVYDCNSTQVNFSHMNVANTAFFGAISDADILADAGLLRRGSHDGHPNYSVTPDGIRYYEQMKSAAPAIVEKEIRRYLDDEEFQRRHGPVFAKWERAAALLWSADSAQQFTTIGHLCREVMQDFVTSVGGKRGVVFEDQDISHTENRLRQVLTSVRADVGNTFGRCLDALVAYWRTVSDLAQRQEHGSQRECKELVWEDGRRLVFQTCVVMFEIDRAVK